MDISAWLRGLNLERYEGAFRENDIEPEVLPDLTADDLIAIGVTSVGHRRKLLAAIAAMRAKPAQSGPAEAEQSAPSIPPSPRTSSDAERRHLTVLFCDLVDSTALAAKLDPEDLREILSTYRTAVSEQVARFDGIVAKFMGDGVLVYFGYPKAHEDDAERAIRTALAITERIGTLKLGSRVLAVRIGIATGLVVVGDLIGSGDAQERGVVGETPNLAARLQSLAEPNSILIAGSTQQLVGGLFEYRDHGLVDIRGLDDAVPVWQVLRPSQVESRFDALHGSILTPLIGRADETDLLFRRWRRATAGVGQTVLVSGEPGIGKSRLTAALQENLTGEPHITLRYFCSQHYRDSAFYPFIAQIERTAGFGREDLPHAKLDKLEALFGEPDTVTSEPLALVSDLLGLPVEGRYPPCPSDPQRKRELTLEALVNQLELWSRQRPVLMIFEDAHWSDSTSVELLDRIVQRARQLPLLVVITFRPEFAPVWAGQAHVTSVTLSRLAQRETTALVSGVTGGKALPSEILERIVERTDGIPLFVEEMTKALLEGGLLREEEGRYTLAGPLPPLAIPSSLQASLLARLDRLLPVKQVAQIGAALGREFSYEMLAAIAPHSERELRDALDQLTEAGLVFRRGTPPHANYIFKHALVQDTAYGTLLRSQRQELHSQIAKVIEERFREAYETKPELLAHHYTQAGMVKQSVAWWGKAGHRSAARSAGVEAVTQFQKALEQMALLPDSPERRREELEIRSSLSSVLFAVKGHAGLEVGQAAARARELWEQAGSPSEYLHIPYGQSRYHAHRGELDLAQRLDEDLLRLSRQRNDSSGLVLGHYSYGRNLMLAGRFAAARANLEEVLQLHNPARHRSLIQQAGDHPHLNAQALLGIVLFCLGYPDQALARTRTAIAEARELGHPASLAASLEFGSRMFSLLGDSESLGQWANQLVVVATEQSFADYHAQGTIFRGWAEVKNGHVHEGISLIRSGSNASRATGAKAWTPYHLALLAGAHAIAGQAEEGISLFNEALQIANRTGEHWLYAELHRQKGQLVLRQGDCAAAEDLYREALNLAAEQEARMWELRAAVSLARLWSEQGKRTAARDVLAPVYGWFSEGFDTPDLQEAAMTLDQLSR